MGEKNVTVSTAISNTLESEHWTHSSGKVFKQLFLIFKNYYLFLGLSEDLPTKVQKRSCFERSPLQMTPLFVCRNPVWLIPGGCWMREMRPRREWCLAGEAVVEWWKGEGQEQLRDPFTNETSDRGPQSSQWFGSCWGKWAVHSQSVPAELTLNIYQ